MAAVEGRADASTEEALASHRMGTRIGHILATTDHKMVGYLYLGTSFAMFLIAGVLAMLMRAELLRPGMQLVTSQGYNQLFTMHGTIMMLLFATPLFAGFANVLVPLQIGAPDVAFPRLNALTYYMFLFGALIVLGGFIVPNGPAPFGWFSYQPLSDNSYSPGMGGDLWVAGLILSGAGTVLTSVNLITTIIAMRAPGMVMFRMPIFTWNVLLTSVMVLIAFPVLTAALFAMLADRKLGTHVYDPSHGGALLWQHLFWFFGHPEVYIVALPFFGIVTEILPVFARKPLFAYLGMVAATIAITGLSMTVWAHHMFATGGVLLPFFSITSFMIAVPTGIKFFNWIGTIWKGQLSFEAPMLWALGFLATFLFGGLTGVILASPPMDFHLTDGYFVVGHLHYVLFGTVVFAMFGGFYFWWPKMTGRVLDETWGKIHFWTLFLGFHTTFLVQHWLGAAGLPRRYATYADEFTTLNTVSSIGSFVLGASTFAFLWNVWRTWRRAPRVGVDDPWGHGNSLEWATSCPPPRHNFTSMPRIRSMRPAFDLHYPPKEPPQEAELATPPPSPSATPPPTPSER
ncbi:cytochrome c oxidase subunit I [Actinomadura sp. WAC 06369]|nr:cytochrome c oxidase subunit I [Actinomadura sp. WAC 06369]